MSERNPVVSEEYFINSTTLLRRQSWNKSQEQNFCLHNHLKNCIRWWPPRRALWLRERTLNAAYFVDYYRRLFMFLVLLIFREYSMLWLFFWCFHSIILFLLLQLRECLMLRLFFLVNIICIVLFENTCLRILA